MKIESIKNMSLAAFQNYTVANVSKLYYNSDFGVGLGVSSVCDVIITVRNFGAREPVY